MVGYDLSPTFCEWAGIKAASLPKGLEEGSIAGLLANDISEPRDLAAQRPADAKKRRRALHELLLPGVDLSGMNPMPLREFWYGLPFRDRRQRDLRFEFGAARLSLHRKGHSFDSSFPSRHSRISAPQL